MDLAEVIRLLENIVRTGTVTEIDEEKWRIDFPGDNQHRHRQDDPGFC